MAINFGELKRIDLVQFLADIGIHPVRLYSGYVLYHAPYREDNHPSFKVSKKSNRWCDLGRGTSGDIVDLGRLIYNNDNIVEVVKLIQQHTTTTLITKVAPGFDVEGKPAGTIRDVTALELTEKVLTDYLASRSVDIDVAKEHCQEVHYTMGAKKYFGIGFANIRGGYEIRNPYFKGSIGHKDISLILTGEHNEMCVVFEGFIDFLSYLTLAKRSNFEAFLTVDVDYLVLNSVSNMAKALKYLRHYETLSCCLDNDAAGRNAVYWLSDMHPGVHDISGAYNGYKDINDYLRGKRSWP